MGFNLKDYETVKSRKKRFYEDHIDGSITVCLMNQETMNKEALFKASVYSDKADQEKDLPRGIGYAYEIRDTELSTAQSGNKYESVNYTSWIENCEESAVGRALDNAGYASNMRCSVEEIEKVERMKPVMKKSNGVENKESEGTQNTQVATEKQEGSYVIPLKKYKGKGLHEIDLSELDSYANWLHKAIDKNNYKGNIENAKEFIAKVDEFMGFDKKTQEESKEVEKIYTTDDLPF